jgi:cytochrome oxidase Cu insertion factor (SCO1/SenC/PrrC family)
MTDTITRPSEVAPSGPFARLDRRGRRTLLLLLAIAIAPVAASYVTYYFFPRATQANHGTLLPIAPAPALAGTHADGTAFALGDLRGRWVLLVADASRCDASCERKLYATRQARTMQGREQERIVRLWLVTDDGAPEPATLARHPHLVVARVPPAAPQALPRGGGAIYLIDPLGNLVLAYDDNADIKGIAKDLQRVLRASGIG